MRWLWPILLLLLCSPVRAEPELRFAASQGSIDNYFYRKGAVAAHLVLRSGASPRIVFAFPAGNSGAGLWFDGTAAWKLRKPVKPVQITLSDGRVRRGVSAEIVVDRQQLVVERALLGSVRVLRDFGYGNSIPVEVEATPVIAGNVISWQRRRLDGGPGYAMTVELLNGTAMKVGQKIRLVSASGGLHLRITALTGDEPLTPLPPEAIFKHRGKATMLRNSFAFLAYREKLLAGSWQYDTYFGRDTLMTLRLLMGDLKPAPIEAGIGAVLDRLSPEGEVAHEEDIGEYALIGRAGHNVGQPVLDYKMVDDDFMLLPVLATYLLDTPDGKLRAKAFLERRAVSGLTYGELVTRNLGNVVGRARPFGAQPVYTNLIALHDGITVGDWRDSQNGLGGDGRYAFSINAALVPAALEAGSRLLRSGLLRDYDSAASNSDELARLAAIWSANAPRMFETAIAQSAAQAHLDLFSRKLGFVMPETLRGDAHFMALALDGKGQPIPVMHSDIGFLLLFLKPDDASIRAALTQIMDSFPSGLMTDAGMLVANPAFADADRAPVFDSSRYHGTVIWSWQQGLMAAGISCQLRRPDLTPGTRALLADAQSKIADAIRRTVPLRGNELWSWKLDGGKIVPLPYGQSAGHETEANAAQLWSGVALMTATTC